jgi:cytochrome c oxidase assembly factor CtaG
MQGDLMLIAAQIAVVSIAAIAYALRAFRMYRAGSSIARSRLCFALAGFIVALAAMLALRSAGRELLYWRMSERLLLSDVSGLLLALGLAPAMLAPLAHTPLRRLLGLTRPVTALALWIANLLIWQWPDVFDAMMRHDSLTLISEVSMIAVSLNMWHALLHAQSKGRLWITERVNIVYVLIARGVGVALACIAIQSPEVFYPYFLRGDSVASTSPLADQGIAGAIMLAEMALVASALLLWTSARLTRPLPATIIAPAAESERAQTASALAMDAQQA